MQDFINKTNPNYLPVNMKVHDLLNMYLSKVGGLFCNFANPEIFGVRR